MLDKKQIRMVFLFEFKMGCKATETATSTMHLAQELLMNVQSSGSKSFAKSLEDEEPSSWPSEVDSNQLRAIIKANPLATLGEVAEELSVNRSTGHLAFEANWKGEKLDKWVLP